MNDELVYYIDDLTMELVDTIAEEYSVPKPKEYSQLIIDIRNFIIREIGEMDCDELEYPF